MRVTTKQLNTIKTLVCQYFGENADLWLFGSRTDDNKKGGDYDFFIETSISDANAIIAGKIELIAKLHDSECFEDEKIDLIIKRRSSNFDMPIYNIAKQEGVHL